MTDIEKEWMSFVTKCLLSVILGEHLSANDISRLYEIVSELED